MSDNTNSAHERTASIDLAQLDKIEAEAKAIPGYLDRDYKSCVREAVSDILEAVNLARHPLTSEEPAEPITLPDWHDAMRAVEKEEGAGAATPLDIFIYANEPAGDSDEAHFRAQLQALIDWVSPGAAAKTEHNHKED